MDLNHEGGIDLDSSITGSIQLFGPAKMGREKELMDSTITPQKLFESGKYRDIETASEVFILMKKIETLESILEDAKKALSGRVFRHVFGKPGQGDNL